MTVYSEVEDARIVELYRGGLGVVKIARRLHHDAGCVSRVLRENSVWVRGSRNFIDGEEEQIAKIYQAGFSAKAIARAYGLRHHISICAALERQGVEQRPPPERNRLYALDPHVFDVIDCEEAAYWLGFLYADSCLHRRTLNVRLKLADTDHLMTLREFFRSESPIQQIESNCSNGKKYPQCHIEFTDAHLAKRLRNLGILPSRPDYRLAVSQVPRCFLCHFVRGYFDGDGSARKNASLAFCGQEDFLLWLRNIFAIEAGTNPHLSVHKHSKANVFYLYISGRLQALKVADFMYRNATFWMARKRHIVDSWPKPRLRRRNEKGQFI